MLFLATSYRSMPILLQKWMLQHRVQDMSLEQTQREHPWTRRKPMHLRSELFLKISQRRFQLRFMLLSTHNTACFLNSQFISNNDDNSMLLLITLSMQLENIKQIEKVASSSVSTVASNLQVIDIDSDNKDPLLCSLYAPEIYYNLRVAEVIKYLIMLHLRHLIPKYLSTPSSFNADHFLIIWKGYKEI